jgi:uncharacterized membrane protein
MEIKTRIKIMYFWTVALIVAGLILNYYGLGSDRPEYTFGSVGNWLIYIGFVGILIATIKTVFRKERKIDERMQFIGAKAQGISFIVFILGAFVIMLADGIKTITLPYHLFMSYLVCVMLIVYFAAYKILLRYY